MFPVIAQIGPLTIYSYGAMLALAVVVCSFLLGRDGLKEGIAPQKLYDLMFGVVVVGILGARVFYIFLNLDYFLENPFEMIMLQKGGLVWQGSLIAGLIAGPLIIRRLKLSLVLTLDLIAPYIALGQAIGRIGCFLNGCCYGRFCPTGILFPGHVEKVYPTQLFDAAGLFAVFLILFYFRKRSKIQGKTFVLYLILAPLVRFVVEFYRGDHEAVWMGLSLFQILCLAVIVLAIYVNSRLKSRS